MLPRGQSSMCCISPSILLVVRSNYNARRDGQVKGDRLTAIRLIQLFNYNALQKYEKFLHRSGCVQKNTRLRPL